MFRLLACGSVFGEASLDQSADQSRRQGPLRLKSDRPLAGVVALQLLGERLKRGVAGHIKGAVFLGRTDAYDLVVTDLTMPSMTGLDLARHMHELRPNLPIIIMTGYGENISTEIQHHPDIQGFIGKPIEMRRLISIIRRVLYETPSKDN